LKIESTAGRGTVATFVVPANLGADAYA
jgi:hypothetical protein